MLIFTVQLLYVLSGRDHQSLGPWAGHAPASIDETHVFKHEKIIAETTLISGVHAVDRIIAVPRKGRARYGIAEWKV